MKNGGWRRILLPPAAVDGRDTGLRFTDILFGFVIFQLFLTLQDAAELPWFVRWQLIVGTTLVLGSWIGFRRSLNRSDYQPKFFNLPLLRFVLDQAMVILYFRIAVLTPNTTNATIDPSTLAHDTVTALLLIFALYAAWDILGIWMTYAREDGLPKYTEIDKDDKKTETPTKPNWAGTAITFVALGLFGLLYATTHDRTLEVRDAEIVFAVSTAFLLAYRMAKEIRTSFTTRVDRDATTAKAPAEGG
jgi:hypothetical protein